MPNSFQARSRRCRHGRQSARGKNGADNRAPRPTGDGIAALNRTSQKRL
jgi:hypothetical protein